jgi:hypothetical protein
MSLGQTMRNWNTGKHLRICRENHWVYHSPQGMDATFAQNYMAVKINYEMQAKKR